MARNRRGRTQQQRSHSQILFRDESSREVMRTLLGASTLPSTLDDLLTPEVASRCVWADVAVYRATEKALTKGVGAALVHAAAKKRLRVVFDWQQRRAYGGVTREFVTQTFGDAQGVVGGLFYQGDDVGLFHPKTMVLGIEHENGLALLGIVGSANLTYGGLVNNTELTVVHAEWSRSKSKTRTALDGWPELSQAIDDYFGAATAFDADNLDDVPETSDELAMWLEPPLAPALALRAYQRQAARQILQAWAEDRRPDRRGRWSGGLVVMPPAAGKTLTALYAMARLLRSDEDARTGLWLSEGPLLASQAFEDFARTPFLHKGVTAMLVAKGQVQASAGDQDVPVGTSVKDASSLVGPALCFTTKGEGKSWRALMEAGRRPEIIVVDEAHHATAPGWSDALQELRPYLVVGLTATPYRKSPVSQGTTDLLERFNAGSTPWLDCFPGRARQRIRRGAVDADGCAVIFGAPVSYFYERETIGDGQPILARPTFIEVPIVDSAGEPFVVVHEGGKQRIRFLESPFEDQDDLAHVDDPHLVEEALEAINEDVIARAARHVEKGRFALVVARNITHLLRLEEDLVELLGSERVDVAHSKDGLTAKQRRHLLAQVREKKASVLLTVDMASEGLDLPAVDALLLPRWTGSERLFWQILGRGLRGPASGGTEQVEIVTYDLRFAPTRDGTCDPTDPSYPIETIDEDLLQSFGDGNHRLGRAKALRLSGRPDDEEDDDDDDEEPDASWDEERARDQVRGVMKQEDFWRVDDLVGAVFRVRVHTGNAGQPIYENKVSNPRAALERQFDNGCRYARYRFIVDVVD